MESHNSTAAHFDDVIGKGGGVLAVVSDVHHCQSEGVLQPCEFRSQLATKIRIETREGLVQQENVGLTNDCPCQGDALLFAAGELVRVARRELLDPNKRECFLCSSASLDSRHIRRAEHEVEILPNREVWPQSEVLEHEAKPSFMRRDDDTTCRRDRDAIQDNFSGVRDFQSGDHPEQCRLAAPAWSDDHCPLPRGDNKRDVVQRQV